MKTKQLIKELKEEIDNIVFSKIKELKEAWKNLNVCQKYDENKWKEVALRHLDNKEKRILKQKQELLKFAEKLVKAINDDVNELLNYFDELRGGMLNRVHVLDFYDELNRILNETLK